MRGPATTIESTAETAAVSPRAERIRRAQAETLEREVVRFAFYRIRPEWRARRRTRREADKREFVATLERHGDSLQIGSYSLVGTRGDCDLLLWQIGRAPEQLHALQAELNGTRLGQHLAVAHSYFALSRASIYREGPDREARGPDRGAVRSRARIRARGARYLFVYPFVKTRAWYALAHERRQELMYEHIRVGRRWPDVRLNTTYSYGLDDQEFVVAFESDYVGRFLDLLMALRLTEASAFTLRDTPSFTCLAMDVKRCLDAIG